MTREYEHIGVAMLFLLIVIATTGPATEVGRFSNANSLSSPAVIGPIVPGPVGTSVKPPHVTANVSISQVEVAAATEGRAQGIPDATNEFDLAVHAGHVSGLVHVDMQPFTEVVYVVLSGRQLNFTYDKAAGSLDVTIPGPITNGILRILYFLAGGVNVGVSSKAATVGPNVQAQAQSTAWVHGYVNTDTTNWKAPVGGIKVELHKNDWPWYTYLATQYTDASGLFDFGNIDLAANGNSLRFRIYVEGWSSGGFGWKQRVIFKNAANLHIEISGDGTWTYGSGDTYYVTLSSTWQDPNTDFDDGLHAYYSVWQEFAYFRDSFGFVTSERGVTTVNLFDSLTASDGYNIRIQSSLYAYTPLITEHEFAHSIMYQAYGDHWAEYYSGCGTNAGDHQDFNYWGNGHVTADPDTAAPCSNDAVNEGWAEFAPAAIQNDGSWPIGDGSGGIAYYQALSDGYGELNEFGYAGALWDLWKTPGQSPSTMFNYIWQTAYGDHPGRVDTFYYDFVSRYSSLTSQTMQAFLAHFVMWSSLAMTLSGSSVPPGGSIGVSGSLSPIPHTGKQVSVYIAPTGSGSWTQIATTNTGSDSAYYVDMVVNKAPGIYDVKTSWTGDRATYTGHFSSDSPVRQIQVVYSVTITKTLTETSTSYAYRTTTTTTTSYTSTSTSTSTIPTVTTIALVPLTVTSTAQGTQFLTSVVTTTVTSYTSTTTSTSTIPTTVALVPLTMTSTAQSTQYLTSILTTTVTSYTSTETSTSTIPTLTTVVLVPSTVTSTVQSTQLVTSTRTTTVTSYTATTTSTSTSVVYTTVTSLPSAGASNPLTYLGFLSLLVVTVGRVTTARGKRIQKVRSLMERRCSTN